MESSIRNGYGNRRRYRKTAAVFLMAFLLAGCQKGESELTEVEIGMEAVEKGDYKGALASFEAEIAEEGDLLRAYRGAGMAYMGMGEYEQAVRSFDAALHETDEKQEDNRKDILCYKAAALYRQQDYDGTIGVCKEILDIAQEGDALYLTGTCYLEKGDEEAAQMNFDLAVQAAPEDYDIYLNIYESYKEKKQSAKGAEYLQQALQAESGKQEDAYYKARIYYNLENYEEAGAQLAGLLEEKNGEALLLMGKIYLAVEDPARSVKMYEQYLAEIGESIEAYNGIVLAKMAQQDYDAALAAVAKGLAMDTEQGKQSLLYNEIVAYEHKGEFTAAKMKAEIYMEKYPADEAGRKEYEFLLNR